MNITIIIPVYNAQPFLKECLDSVYKQTYKDWRCLIVNDGSTDESQSIIDEYCAKDKRFNFVFKENEKSAAKARAFAFDYINSEWVIFVDADDTIAVDCIEKLTARQEETGADIVVGRRVGCSIDLKEELWRIPTDNFDMSRILTGREACSLTLGGWQIGGITLFKRDLDKGLVAGAYMNSDEYLERLRLLRANKVAFVDANYYFRKNIGTSDMISVRMFDRTLVDMQLEKFVLHNFSDNEKIIKTLTWQRLFNLIYLEADYKKNRIIFTNEERKHIVRILKQSYNGLHRLRTIRYVPKHAWMTLFPHALFGFLAECYVEYKRNNGGTFYYR